jgi:cyclic di-GMP phosphodiesterase
MRSKRILVVDDVQQNLLFLGALLESFGYEVETALDGHMALAKLPLDIDLVLLDVLMPGLDGYQVARQLRMDPQFGDVPIVMVTALDSREDRLRAIEAGANDFIAKPVDRTELLIRVGAQLKLKAAQDALRWHQRDLQRQIERRTAALRLAVKETAEAQRRTHDAHLDTIRRLVLATEVKDPFTAGHLQRIGQYSTVLARALHLLPGEVENLSQAIPMHDVGKLGIPDAILLKSGPLTARERAVMQSHTLIGARLLSGSPSSLVQAGEAVALTHHEHWDGGGYPQGLKGDEIPLCGRLCAVVDVFDALTSDRPYRQALPHEEVLARLREGRGTRFDPAICDLFFANLPAITLLRERFKAEPLQVPPVAAVAQLAQSA